NYFYPDLPQGYQISQYKSPIVGEGEVVVALPDGETVRIGIERLHLEQDAGKLLHEQHPDVSLVDLNRSGVALMEIVSKPDLRSAEEAKAFLFKLRSILRYLGTCDGDMEKGSLRADVNVSVRKPGAPLGTRCEIKNVNSVRFVRQAVDYEARRQVELIEGGGSVRQETRRFDPNRGETRSMRSKEEAHDYRYFPDPDLVPLVLPAEMIAALERELPELPDEKKARFIADYKLTPYDAGLLAAERETAAFFEAVARGRDAKLAANWVTGDYFAALNRSGRSIGDFTVSAAKLAGLLDLIADGTISGRIAKEVFELMVEGGKDAAAIVAEKGLRQVTDTGAIAATIDQVIAANADKLAEYRAGKEKLFGFFVGQVMKATGGKANPAAVNELLKQKLAG
ncbi:MAG TPA: Asp-tRNA(Asn)/Glu-tRNA(Gln) amidotransferase subunit GatB, partial [Candidatus Sulfotelmatobacter sp.]|nr:Asp-tRNA(Asn)/Glu-tRNA(Gln) amidotransferase subunit GatB [Candidatus Sulfotelmatobacter sp.]